MAIVTLTMNGQQVSGKAEESLLEIARQHDIPIPTLCHLDGLSDVGACRLCLVEIEGSTKLQPACVTKPVEGMVVHTDTDRLRRYRRMIVELLASEGNHHCAVCVVNNHCGLQNLAYDAQEDARRHAQGLHHRPQPVRPVHAMRPRLPRGRGGPYLGHRRPRHRLRDHC
ncbi:MAG: bidirectional hydrogenase complex protein HoxU [candidate division NC10 bacterium]|nr:bidirectional hydrogenase complex protein HoxU [candidate division NC10 bacterium]